MHTILIFILAFFLFTNTAQADCTSPAGVETQTNYDFTNHVLRYCDGTNWINSGGGISVESDPQVSATTSGKWCRGNGSAVTCDQNAPSVNSISIGTNTAVGKNSLVSIGSPTAPGHYIVTFGCNGSTYASGVFGLRINGSTQWAASITGGTHSRTIQVIMDGSKTVIAVPGTSERSTNNQFSGSWNGQVYQNGGSSCLTATMARVR